MVISPGETDFDCRILHIHKLYVYNGKSLQHFSLPSTLCINNVVELLLKKYCQTDCRKEESDRETERKREMSKCIVFL